MHITDRRTKMFQRLLYLSITHNSLLVRQRVNRILRIRYGLKTRPHERPDPLWLRAHD